jgi:MoxR-like ATPase
VELSTTLPEERIEATIVAKRLQDQLERVVFGQSHVIQSLLVSIISGGHVLLEGVPGLAKTLLVRSLGKALNCSFSRIQFTPDLMPADVTGLSIYDTSKNEFTFRAGPLFADLVLADEINRTPAKTQAALLEAMQESQVSVDGKTHILSPTFMVVATQNPVESEGTYPLPEAQLDRFLLKVTLDYPDQGDEKRMLVAMHNMTESSLHPENQIEAVAGPADILQFRKLAQQTSVDDSVLDYILELVRNSRELPLVELGCSPRAAIMLMQASKALAVLRGRDFVSPDEVQAMALPVLRHRLVLTPEAEIEGVTADDCLDRLVANSTVPR